MKTINSPKRRAIAWRVLTYPFRLASYCLSNPSSCYLKGHAELDLFPTDEQRQIALRRTATRVMFKRPHFIAAGAAIVTSLVTTLALRDLVGNWGLPISQTMINLILMFPVIIPCALFGVWLLSRYVPKLLRHELLDCGVPICVPCGYPLIGLPGPNCPECGRPFDEKVREILDTDADPSFIQ